MTDLRLKFWTATASLEYPVAAALLFFVGCAGPSAASRAKILEFYPQGSPKAAVLLFDNQSVDVGAPASLRKMVVSRLRQMGYDVMELERVDAGLKKLGITDGGQLGSASPEALGRALGVPGLFYGTIEDFTFTNVGFWVKRRVRLRLRFIAASGEQVLWENVGEGSTNKMTLKKNEAGRRFIRGMAEKALENMFDSALAKESKEAVERVLYKLPSF